MNVVVQPIALVGRGQIVYVSVVPSTHANLVSGRRRGKPPGIGEVKDSF